MFADIAKTANSKSNESRMEMTTIFSSNGTKGQLISQCPFGVIVSTKMPTKFPRIAALASKEKLNQKLYYTKHFK